MRKILSAAIFALACLWLPQAARAQVYGSVSTGYDPATNRMVAYAETSATYGAGMFYCVQVVVYLRSTGGQETAGAQWNCDVGYAFASASLPYDPDAEYDADADHQGDPYFQDSYGQYMDYYNLQTYMQGERVVYPGAFDFIGTGPPVPSVGSILLGATYAIFSLGAAHGTPHHLKVLSDNTEMDCGASHRRIRFQVVDSSGRRAASRTRPLPTKETFHDPNNGANCPDCAYNSCRRENIWPTPCTPDLGGEFTDHLWVGCPLISGECGTAFFVSKWSWCPRGRAPVVLTPNTYHLGRSFVRVNGVERFNVGTHLYP
jgi:hypothetical protein